MGCKIRKHLGIGAHFFSLRTGLSIVKCLDTGLAY